MLVTIRFLSLFLLHLFSLTVKIFDTLHAIHGDIINYFRIQIAYMASYSKFVVPLAVSWGLGIVTFGAVKSYLGRDSADDSSYERVPDPAICASYHPESTWKAPILAAVSVSTASLLFCLYPCSYFRGTATAATGGCAFDITSIKPTTTQ